MSQALLQEAKKISEKLSDAEKIQLFDWLSIQLPHNSGVQQIRSTESEPTEAHAANGHSSSTAATIEDEFEPTWTTEEVRAMIRPEPKTGAEIAAMLESGEIDTTIGREMEISDVVTWLENLRRQERIDRGLEG